MSEIDGYLVLCHTFHLGYVFYKCTKINNIKKQDAPSAFLNHTLSQYYAAACLLQQIHTKKLAGIFPTSCILFLPPCRLSACTLSYDLLMKSSSRHPPPKLHFLHRHPKPEYFSQPKAIHWSGHLLPPCRKGLPVVADADSFADCRR